MRNEKIFIKNVVSYKQIIKVRIALVLYAAFLSTFVFYIFCDGSSKVQIAKNLHLIYRPVSAAVFKKVFRKTPYNTIGVKTRKGMLAKSKKSQKRKSMTDNARG